MTEWEPSDGQHLRAAEGWLDLGLAGEARAEMALVPARLQGEPVALMLRWRIHAETHEWLDALAVATDLVTRDPENVFGWIHRSYALHELRRTEEAWEKLYPVLRKFCKEELIPYNLACYACRLGRIDEARTLMLMAMERGDAAEIRARALVDEDLTAMRAIIRELRC